MIVALVAVVVMVAGVILWRFFGDALSNRSHTAAARCVGGKDTVAVIADPSIADQVKESADSYNASAGPVGDRCVAVAVTSAGSDAVINGFIGKWPTELGGQPGLWIPSSSISAARLTGAAGSQAISDSRSLVISPVLLAVRPELQQALANQNWAALPGLQTNRTRCPAWTCLPGDHCGWQCRAVATAMPRIWPARRWLPRQHLLARQQQRVSARCAP